MQTAQSLYGASVRSLPPRERLKLAALILDDLAASPTGGLDWEDAWTDEDVKDLTAHALRRAGHSLEGVR